MSDVNVSYLVKNSCWGVSTAELSKGSSWMILKK